MSGQHLVGPCVAIAPVPAASNVAIQASVVLGVDVAAENESYGGIGGASDTQLPGTPQLQIGADDFDRAAQCALSFSRCRAALARLPHVAMSHQRRRPFFVLSKKTRWQRGSAQRRTRHSSPRIRASAADSTRGMTRPANASPTGTNER